MIGGSLILILLVALRNIVNRVEDPDKRARLHAMIDHLDRASEISVREMIVQHLPLIYFGSSDKAKFKQLLLDTVRGPLVNSRQRFRLRNNNDSEEVAKGKGENSIASQTLDSFSFNDFIRIFLDVATPEDTSEVCDALHDICKVVFAN